MDTQRTRVYKWEDTYFPFKNKKPISVAECTSLVEDVCRCYGLPMPRMSYPQGYQADASHYMSRTNTITLYKHFCHKSVVLHEVAHYINHQLNGSSVEGHGPQFFSIYAYLINKYGGFPLLEIFSKAEKHGIKWATTFPQFKEEPKPNLVGRYRL